VNCRNDARCTLKRSGAFFWIPKPR
jgi:hypothetical protein